MSRPIKVFSDVHNGDRFTKTNIKCDHYECGHLLYQRLADTKPPASSVKSFRTQADEEADAYISKVFHNEQHLSSGVDAEELLCIECGFHSVSRSCISLGMIENDYSSLNQKS